MLSSGFPYEDYWKKKQNCPFHLAHGDLLLIDLQIEGLHLELSTVRYFLSQSNNFFKTRPLACDPSSLPKYPPSKEIDAKLREEEARKKGALGVEGHKGEIDFKRSKKLRAAPAPDANAELARSMQRRHGHVDHWIQRPEANCLTLTRRKLLLVFQSIHQDLHTFCLKQAKILQRE
ncbi:hypothetical protein ACS0TY_018441 [Phlomoides rotata]